MQASLGKYLVLVLIEISISVLAIRARNNGRLTHLSYCGAGVISIFESDAYLSTVTHFYVPESAH